MNSEGDEWIGDGDGGGGAPGPWPLPCMGRAWGAFQASLWEAAQSRAPSGLPGAHPLLGI